MRRDVIRRDIVKQLRAIQELCVTNAAEAAQYARLEQCSATRQLAHVAEDFQQIAALAEYLLLRELEKKAS